MAFRLEALDIDGGKARASALARVDETHEPDLPEPDSGACLDADDILEFGAGVLPPARSLIVQRHLDGCAACMDLLTLAIGNWQTHEPGEWPNVATNFCPGDRVDGRFSIVRFLARGGMGEVYEAVDAQTGRRVALKAVLAASSDNRAMLRSFRREARMGRCIRHPNVCWVHPPADVDGPHPLVPYFTMDYVDGYTLSDHLRRRPLCIDEVSFITHQLLAGLRAIHDAGVLHLDLKSSNIMLQRGSPQQAIILDFGLARRASYGGRVEPVHPVTGSLAYMPPEQILGRAPSIQNDIFALGVVLFEMLTGELPFPAAEASTTSCIIQRLTARAPAPSSVSPGAPAWLDALVLRCLAEPAWRYRNVEALRQAFDTQLQGSCGPHVSRPKHPAVQAMYPERIIHDRARQVEVRVVNQQLTNR